jgi:hypothetical protein
MRFAKARIFALSMLYLLPFCAVGCLGGIDPNADKVLVVAERTYQSSFEAVNTFLKLEHDNQAFVKAQMPSLHEAAQSIREDARRDKDGDGVPDGGVFADAEKAIELYRLLRTPETQAAVKDKLLIVSQLASQAKQAIASIEAKSHK